MKKRDWKARAQRAERLLAAAVVEVQVKDWPGTTQLFLLPRGVVKTVPVSALHGTDLTVVAAELSVRLK